MNLKTEDLKHLFSKHLKTLNKESYYGCPSEEKIIEAISLPSKKTRKIIDHILECNRCFIIFNFLLDLIKLENDFISSIQNLRPTNKKEKKYVLNIRFLKIAPYAAFILFLCISLGVFIKYINPSKNNILRSIMTEAYLSLIYDETSSETCPFLLKWDQIDEAKTYLIRIFDSSLVIMWTSITQEAQIKLPPEICNMINNGNLLLINFEAEDSEGNIIFSWMGKFPDIKTNSGQKVSRIRLR